MNSKEARENIQNILADLKSGAIGPLEAMNRIMEVLQSLDLKDEDVKGLTSLIISFVNRVLSNLEKRGG